MYRSLIFFLFIQFCGSKYFNVSNIFINEKDSYFGYSVQVQVSNISGRVIVGAPRSSGVVYTCPITTKKCEKIQISENNLIGLGTALDADPSQNGTIITCAPRWNGSSNSTIGMCFLLKNNIQNKLYPLQNTPLYKSGLYNSQFGQVGFSAHLIKNQLILGAPGVYDWTGTLAQYNNLNVVEESLINNAERADNKIKRYSYFGYSVSAGKFNVSNPEQIFYVSGAPRNNDLYGSVNIFDPIKNELPFKDRYMFRGTQFGEYFGASITVGDINADNLDDVIVGAPTHSNDNSDDIGCIYVFQAIKNDKMIEFNKYVQILGEKKGGKFGFALSYLGDINNDGFGDVAVGAPYYENSGAVYIYFGSENGLKIHYKQRLIGTEIDKNLRGFGYSLSRGLDLDHNTNNDLAVGAYLSGQIVVLTSQPIIKIQTSMMLAEGSQLNINTTYLTIQYCLIYEANLLLPVNTIQLKFTIKSNKITFENGDTKWTHNLYMQGKNQTCSTFKIFVKEKIFSDINVEMDYDILTEVLEEKFKPLEDQHLPTYLRIPFNKECNSKICQPNLNLTAYIKDVEKIWVIGSSQNMELVVNLENNGEASYTNKLLVKVFPEHLKFTTFPNYCEQSNYNISCSFKNPILQHEKKNISFGLDAKKIEIEDHKLSINVTILSHMDTDLTDNSKFIEISLLTDVNFKISLKSQPEEISIQHGLQLLNHQYNIENVGVTNIKKLKLFVLIPYQLKERKFLHFVEVGGCSQHNLNDVLPINGMKNSPHNSLFVNCSGINIKCWKFECDIINTKSFSINVSMTINSTLLSGLHDEGPIILSTALIPDFKFISNYSYVRTILLNKPQTANVTKWIIIGILIALLLVFILLVVLYKCGFFSKQKIPDHHEYAQLTSGYIVPSES